MGKKLYWVVIAYIEVGLGPGYTSGVFELSTVRLGSKSKCNKYLRVLRVLRSKENTGSKGGKRKYPSPLPD